MRYDGIKPDDIIDSIHIEQNIDRIFTAGQGAGKSGSFFFFSSDNRFIIKTMRGSERHNLIKMLDGFIDHIKESNN